MKKLFAGFIYGLFALTFTGTTLAADRGSADEAVAMVKKAVAYIKANGKEKAFAEFNNPKGQFIDRDLYIFTFDMDGKMLAHGANPKLLGSTKLLDLKDADGKRFTREFIEVANAKGKGWVDYRWPNPVSKTIELKSSYIEKVDDMVVGCGIYK